MKPNERAKFILANTIALLIAPSVSASDCTNEQTRELLENNPLVREYLENNSLEDLSNPKGILERQRIRSISLAAEATSVALRKEVTGVGADVGASAKRNYLPGLISLVGLGGSLFGDGVSSTEDNLIFSYNQGLGTESAGKLNFQVSFNRKPSLSPELLEAVPEINRVDFQALAANSLDLTDDIEYAINYELGAGGMATDANEDVKKLVSMAFSAKLHKLAGSQALSVNDSSEIDGDLNNYKIAKLAMRKNKSLADQASVCKELFEVQRIGAQIDFTEADKKLIEKIAKNKPQLEFSAKFKERSALIGADSVSAKIKYSYSFGMTPKKLEKIMSDKLKSNQIATFDELKNAEELKNSMERSDRIAFSIEYVESDAHNFSNSLAEVDFSKMASRSFIAELTYGRFISDLSRFDLAYKFENVSDDSERNDRSTAILSFAKRVDKKSNFTVPLTLIYSNKPEFVRENSFDQFSAHIGIKWEFEGIR